MSDESLLINAEPPKTPHIWIPGVTEETPNDFKQTKWERHPHGIIIYNGQEIAHTLQCPHHGGHFISYAGSGHRRTWCMKCAAVTCGAPECDECKPDARQFGTSQGRML